MNIIINNNGAPPTPPNPTMIPPRVETVIMYVPPTREDLDRIQLELELDIEEDDTFAAAIRVSNDEEEQRRYAEDLVCVILSSNESLLRQCKQ